MIPCEIRRAAVGDIPDMQRVIRAAMEQYARNSSIPTMLEALAETKEDLERYILEDCFLLAFRGAHLAGTLRISSAQRKGGGEDAGGNEQSPKDAYISRFAVSASMQKLGVGKALFASAEEYLMQNGYRRVFLHTALTNAPLVRFYTSRGFCLIETSNDRGYPRGTFQKTYE